jgi:uncharacterized repeat protein (TIGR02543 family)
MHVKSHLKRLVVVLAIALPVASVMTLASASTASAATSARPGEPRHVTAVAGNNSAIVRFLPPSSNGGDRVDRYDILSETTVSKQVYTCTATDCRVGGLTAGTLYFFQVAAVTKVGRGAYSLPSKVVTVTGSVAITFNTNGGSGIMAPETEPYDATAALTPNAFTYVGYTFAGWNAKANGSGTAFTDGALAKFNGNATFYAQWTVGSATTATITFNANGGTGSMANETENLNFSTALTTDVFIRTGYTFSGWNTAASGNGTSYANGATYAFTASITLYAQWTTAQITTPFTGAESPNWSGYVLPSATDSAYFTYVSGEWKVPTLNCADTPNSNSATWVGTGGDYWAGGGYSGALLQTGTEDDCVNGVQEDRGWWFLVDPSWDYGTYFSSFPISPGDTMIAKVEINTDDQWVTVLENLTTGLQGVFAIGDAWDVSTISGNILVGGIQGNATNTSYSGGDSAEWVQEDETISSTGSLEPFANYGTVTFSNLTTNLSSWTLPNSDAYEIVQNGVPLSVPEPVVNDGFTVNYTGP